MLRVRRARRRRGARLLSYSATPSADGSVALVLDFNAFAPAVQIVHASRNDVKIVIIGAERGPHLPAVIDHVGEIEHAVIAPFAGVGLVVDMRLADDVRPRAQTFGSRIVVHVPAHTGDEEAHCAGWCPPRLPGVKVIPLSYADASEIAGLIAGGVSVPSVDMFNAQSPFAAPTPPPNSSSSYPSPTLSSPNYVTLPTSALIPKDTPQGVYINPHVSVDRRLNAVVLRGTPDEIAPYERLIALVDTPRRSVMLDTQIVELTESAAYDLGVNFSPNGSNLASATFNAGNSGKPAASLSLSAQLQALAMHGQAKILASPKILASDNRDGRDSLRRSGADLHERARSLGRHDDRPAATAIHQRRGEPRDSAAHRRQWRRYGEYLLGSLEHPELRADRAANRGPSRTHQRRRKGWPVDLDRRIAPGYRDQILRQIPGLGDIPLIGDLFKQETSTSQRTNLYLVITPHVLTKGSTAAHLLTLIASSGCGYDRCMKERNTQPDSDAEDRDEAVVAADDTGILSEQRQILEAEIAERLGTDPGA